MMPMRLRGLHSHRVRRSVRRSSRVQRGLSLVELMVGITVGLFVVAAASTLVSLQLVDNRRLVLETQVQQDLRASADIIARDVRRAGLWGPSTLSAAVWRAGDTAFDAENRNLAITPAAGGAVTQIEYQLSRPGANGPWGFRLQNEVIESRYMTASLANVWQPLTDPTTMRVTQFDITPINEPPVQLTCQSVCAAPSAPTACWPTLEVRAFRIDIEGVARSDDNVVRRVRQVVHLRNDAIRLNDASSPGRTCPP